jgi:phage terminase large subunit-like protein
MGQLSVLRPPAPEKDGTTYSWKQKILARPDAKEVLSKLSPRECKTIMTSWAFNARHEQFEPEGDDWRVWMFTGGRGAGKTRSGAEWIVHNALVRDYKEQAIVSTTHSDLIKTMIFGSSGIKSVCPNIEVNKSDKIITFPNGNKVYGDSAEKPDSLRGPNLYSAWVDELSSWRYDEECWNMLKMTLRLGNRPRVFVSSTPKPRPFFKKLMQLHSTIVTKCSTFANAKNLSADFIKDLLELYEGTRLGRQELNAEILEDNEGALWNRDLIEKCRRIDADAKSFSKIIVAVDPATTSNQKSDDTGIMVCATDGKRGYVLKDGTLKGTPKEWGERVIKIAQIYNANLIVAEGNNGGDLVKTVLNSIDDKIPVKMVHASNGKRARAEPVSMLYEQFKVHHVGTAKEFMELEDEMCEWDKKSTSSPNRIDAMVWGISSLMLTRQPRIRML